MWCQLEKSVLQLTPSFHGDERRKIRALKYKQDVVLSNLNELICWAKWLSSNEVWIIDYIGAPGRY